MPATQWADIVGYRCKNCNAWASHWYGEIPLCCQCHGGNICSAAYTRGVNELAAREYVEELIGEDAATMLFEYIVWESLIEDKVHGRLWWEPEYESTT